MAPGDTDVLTDRNHVARDPPSLKIEDRVRLHSPDGFLAIRVENSQVKSNVGISPVDVQEFTFQNGRRSVETWKGNDAA